MSEKRQSSPSASPRKELHTEEGSVNVQQVGEEGSEQVFHGQVDIEPTQPENTISKGKDSLKKDRDHDTADGLVPRNLTQDQFISASKKETTGVGLERAQAMAGELKSEEDSVQDQTIIAPEIMSLILEKLDLRRLKQVRLVCKSWLLLAQYHLLRRGIVHLSKGTLQSSGCSEISKFVSLCQKRIRALPLPFQFVDVDLNKVHGLPSEIIIDHLSRLPPPLAVTRFSTGALSLHLAIHFIIQCSSTLEFLQLSVNSFDAKKVSQSQMDHVEQLNFAKLRHVIVKTRDFPDIRFPSVVALLAKNSPSLEAYECECGSMHMHIAEDVGSQLCLQVDIKNVRNLTLSGYRLNTVALNHFLTTPFTQLQNLNISVVLEGSILSNMEALTATVTKCANSLTTLDLSSVYGNIADLKLPLCPNVRELTLRTLKESDGILSYLFPTLQVVNVREIEFDLDRNDDWNSFSPLFEVTTLRILHLNQFYHGYTKRGCMGDGGYSDDDDPWENELVWTRIGSKSNSFSSKQLITFLNKFPGLERLCIQSSSIIGLCEGIRDKKCDSSLLEGVKHLELCGKECYDYSPLAVLKGIETITMLKFNDSVPVVDLPCLKLLQFPWSAYSNMNIPKLMEITSQVDRVAVTNCCSFSIEADRVAYTNYCFFPIRTGDAQSNSKKLLETFFESVSNAECGCKDRNQIPRMMLRLD